MEPRGRVRAALGGLAACAALSGCAGLALVGSHNSNAQVNGVSRAHGEECDVTGNYAGIGGWRAWQHERGTTRVYGTLGIKETNQCWTLDADGRDISPGANLLVIREFDRRN